MARYKGQQGIKGVPLGEILNPFAPNNVQIDNARIRRENERAAAFDARQVPSEAREYIEMQESPWSERLTPWQGPTQYQNKVNKAENAAREVQNARLQRRQDMQSALPERLRDNDYARQVVNAAENVANALDGKPILPITLGVLGAGTAAVAGGAGLQAYSELSSEYAPVNVGTVAGRAVSNVFGGGGVGAGAVGVDPLAEARNSVARAAELVGTEGMLEALTADKVKEMGDTKAALVSGLTMDQVTTVASNMIDERARELMQTPIEFSDGDIRTLRYDEAIRYATEQVHMDLRANSVY